MDWIAYVGLLAAILTVLAFSPQLLKVWKTKSTKDISLGMLTIFCSGNVSWVIYGILIKDAAVTIANLLVFVQAFIIITFKVKYK